MTTIRNSTTEKIQQKGFDVVMAAIGNEAVMPRIPGSDAKSVHNVVDVFGRHAALGKRVVFIFYF